MKRTTILLGCIVLLMTISSCKENDNNSTSSSAPSGHANADMSKAKADIQLLENKWADVLTKRDINGLMELYTDDAVSMQDGDPSLKGKAAIREQQEKDFAAPPRYASISFQTQDVYGTADELTEVGTSEEKDASGKITGTGKYMAVFRKVGEQYKCVREIYNSDTKR